MSDELEVAEQIARTAGAGLLTRFGDHAGNAVTTKSSPTDLVSEADVESERTIRDALRERFPDDGILGEEGDDQAGTSGRRWIVDPLDGTTNFLFGIPQWAVSIACEGVCGVVYDPVRDELFAADVGGRVTLDGVPLAAPRRDELAVSLVGTGFAYDAAVRAKQAATLTRVLPAVRDIRRGGSAALDLAWTAAGRLDAFFERGLQPWDLAAGAIICRAAGLEVRELAAGDGGPAGVLVAGAAVVDELLGLVSPA